MGRILITGANGFVGTRLAPYLAAKGHDVVAAVRCIGQRHVADRITLMAIGDLERQPDWLPLLAGVDGVVHLAGRAHVLRHETAPLEVARCANVAPTLSLFSACHRAQVRRLVYVSSVHVLGTASGPKPFSEADPAAPQDPYAQSKWEAECGLRELAAKEGAPQLVVVRPTVVCGPYAKGNLARLVRLVSRRLPLPFGAVSAPRNFVGLTNLCDLLERSVTHAIAAGKIYLAADPETLLLPDLIRTLASALNTTARLIPVPPALLAVVGTLTGQRAQIERLTHSLLVDGSLARAELGWGNEVALAQEMSDMARSLITD